MSKGLGVCVFNRKSEALHQEQEEKCGVHYNLAIS
jgi:hypothetical protein